MIPGVVTAKLTAYALPIIGTLVVVAGLAFWWLWAERDDLLAKTATQRQALSNAAHANRENLSTIKSQKAEIQWREAKAIERQKRLGDQAEQLAATQAELQEAMQDAPECVSEPWPDAVFDIMRRNTVADPDRVRAADAAPELPSPNPDTRATAPDRPVP